MNRSIVFAATHQQATMASHVFGIVFNYLAVGARKSF